MRCMVSSSRFAQVQGRSLAVWPDLKKRRGRHTGHIDMTIAITMLEFSKGQHIEEQI